MSSTLKAPEPEQRTATIAVEDVRAEGKTLHGFAALYGVESRDLGGFTETIAPGAFDQVLASEPDVFLSFNHSPDKILARTTSGTLRLRDDERGLVSVAGDRVEKRASLFRGHGSTLSAFLFDAVGDGGGVA